jgi:N-acetylglutamate synthase-like GNAT family acetyltransferase
MSKLMTIIKRNQGANNNIRRAYNAGIIKNIIKRLVPMYSFYPNMILRNGGSRYSVFNTTGNFVGFASVRNYGNTREIEFIATKKGYGDKLLQHIISNAKKNKKKNIELTAANTSNKGSLVKWYQNRGFKSIRGGANMKKNI